MIINFIQTAVLLLKARVISILFSIKNCSLKPDKFFRVYNSNILMLIRIAQICCQFFSNLNYYLIITDTVQTLLILSGNVLENRGPTDCNLKFFHWNLDSLTAPSTFDSRIHAVFWEEFTWSRLLRSPFHVQALPAVLCWTSSCRRSFPNATGVWGRYKPPAGPGQSSGGGPGGKAPGAPEIWHLKVQNTAENSTSWLFSFLLQNDHPSDVPNRANDTFAQI